MRVVFISANERLDSGLLQSQFVKPAQELKSTEVKVTIVNLHRPFYNRYIDEDINVINLPILVPFRFINFTKIYFLNEILTLFYALVISFFLKREDKICCRGYITGLIGFWLSKFAEREYIFDARSLYVHENTGIYMDKESKQYNYWLKVESRIVKRARKIISVSSGQQDYYKNTYSIIEKESVIIPCYATVNELKTQVEIGEIRKSLGFSEDDIIVGYVGSLNNGWNNVHLYERYFEAIVRKKYKLLIISQDKHELLARDFFRNKDVKVLSFNDRFNGVAITLETIQVVDYGIVLLNHTYDWFTRLTVKFVDYTSNGLPVIVHKNVGEAYNLTKEFSISPSVTIHTPDDIKNLVSPTMTQRKFINRWASDYFAKENVKKILR